MIKRKSYAPAHVKNPSSVQHLVWLQPGQTLVLHLKAEDYNNPKVEISKSHVKQIGYEQKDDEHVFLFIQDEHVIDWGDYSSCHLADIWVDSEKTTARLVVMMQCVNPLKQNFVTIINPDVADLRLRPHDVMEVILYDTRFRDQDEWNWEWEPKCDVALEHIGYDSMNIHMWHRYYTHEESEQPNYAYARVPRTDGENNPWCRQHHIWFRFTSNILELMDKENGLKHVGNVRFYGWPDKYNKNTGYLTEYHLSVVVNLSATTKSKVYETLAMKQQSLCSSPMPTVAAVPYFKKQKVQRHYGPTIRDVEFKLIDYKTLDEGCNTEPADPPRRVLYEGDSGDCDTGCHSPYFPRQHHNHWGIGGRHYHNEYHDKYGWLGAD